MATNLRLGILGGGQLSLMLCDAAKAMGHQPIVYAQSPHEPACLDNESVLGPPSDDESLSYFFSQVDVVGFENEFVDCERLEQVSRGHQVTFYPPLETIALVQDKLQQKKVLQDLAIPCAKHMTLRTTPNETLHSLRHALKEFGPCVLKWARMGYDGKGVMLLDDTEESLSHAIHFCELAVTKNSRVYAEEFVAFKRELAIVAVFSPDKDFVSYPVVVSEQEDNICSRVFGPANQFGLSDAKEDAIKSYAYQLAHSLNLVGAFAIELFETQDGRILANEIAPRVHNSGHYTQDACVSSQFDNHCRALLGKDLAEAASKPFFAMLNFLGPKFSELPLVLKGMEKVAPHSGRHSKVHWYGKSELRASRKMGHINGCASNEKELYALLEELEGSRLQWTSELNAFANIAKEKTDEERHPNP